MSIKLDECSLCNSKLAKGKNRKWWINQISYVRCVNMRKHFLLQYHLPLVVDEANINRALILIDVASRDSGLGVLRKMSFKTPALLKNLRLEKNLDYLKTEIKKTNSGDHFK